MNPERPGKPQNLGSSLGNRENRLQGTGESEASKDAALLEDESVAKKHSEALSRWHDLLVARTPREVATLTAAEFEEVSSLLEEGYQDALIELGAKDDGIDLERAAVERSLERLGSWDELFALLGRSATRLASENSDPLPEPVADSGSASALERVEGTLIPPRLSWLLTVPRALSESARLLRMAARSLWRTRSVAASSIALLTLGLGAAVSLFSVFHAVILADLPYPGVERLGIVRTNALGRLGMPRVSASNVLDFRSSASSISEVQLASFPKLSIGKDTDFGLVRVASIGAGLPRMLGVEPATGRLFEQQDVPTEGVGNVLLTHALWMSRFAGDQKIVGKTIYLSEQQVEVVGVLKPGQQLWLGPDQPADVALWTVRRPISNRGAVLSYSSYVRLAEGATFDEASAEIQALADRGSLEDQLEGERALYEVTPLMNHLVEDSRPSLSLLLAAAVFVLFLACVNVAGLLSARALSQREEWAVRAALGASRLRLLLSGLAEGVVVAIVSGVLGTVLALALLRVAARSSMIDLPRAESVSISPFVLLFALAATLLTALLAGVLPAWRAGRLAEGVGVDQSRGGISGAVAGGTALVVAQVALALLMLAGTGALLRTVAELQRVELGYDADRIVAFDFSLSRKFASSGARRMELNRSVVRRLEELPEVETVSIINRLPMGRPNLASYSFDTVSRRSFGELTGSFHRIFPRYFETMGITLLDGRGFNETDMESPNAAVIVSQSLAESAWPDGSAVGKYLTIEFATPSGGTEPGDARVVGVVGDIREIDLHSVQPPQAYLAYGESSWAQDFVVRTTVPASALVPKIDRLLAEFGPGLVVDDATAFSKTVWDLTRDHRLAINLTGGFSVLALLIASLGIYAAMAHRVATRTREIGLRMAMGADRDHLLRWVMKRGLGITGIGIGLGLGLSAGLLRLLDSFVFGVSSRDPATLSGVAGVLLLAATVACWLPAKRATRVDPVVALGAD